MSFSATNPWFVKAIILVGILGIVIIPASLLRGGPIKVVKSGKERMERVLLTLTSLGFFLPLVLVATPVVPFADFQPRPFPFFTGTICLALGLWFHYRSPHSHRRRRLSSQLHCAMPYFRINTAIMACWNPRGTKPHRCPNRVLIRPEPVVSR